MIYKCLRDNCGFLFSRTGEPEACPDCGSKAFRPADNKEQQEAFQIFTAALSGENLESITDSEGYLIDGWLQKIYIRYPGKFNKGNFDIISAGSDGVFGENGSASDIPADMEKYKDEEGDSICDDLANFL